MINKLLKAYLRRNTSRQVYDKNISFYNFWSINQNKVQDVWLANFIIHHIHPLNKVNLFSVFGNKEVVRFIKSPKIFFTGENIHTKVVNAYFDEIDVSYFKHFDLALGFDYEDLVNKDNYLRFPLWLMYLFPYDASYEYVKKIIASYNDPRHRSKFNRNRFASNISRHDNNGIRGKIIDIIEKIDEVECGGDFRNNTNALLKDYKDDKLKYLMSVRFNICPENSDAMGYVTEKVFESFQAGSIPIYWGSGNNPEPDILNSKAIIFYDPLQPDSAYQLVQSLEDNDENYNSFILNKPFKEGAEDIIWDKFVQLKQRLNKFI